MYADADKEEDSDNAQNAFKYEVTVPRRPGSLSRRIHASLIRDDLS